MKKLNLKLGGIREMLSREQMKKVVGGYSSGGGGGCPASECPCSDGLKPSWPLCNPGGQDTSTYCVCVK